MTHERLLCRLRSAYNMSPGEAHGPTRPAATSRQSKASHNSSAVCNEPYSGVQTTSTADMLHRYDTVIPLYRDTMHAKVPSDEARNVSTSTRGSGSGGLHRNGKQLPVEH